MTGLLARLSFGADSDGPCGERLSSWYSHVKPVAVCGFGNPRVVPVRMELLHHQGRGL